MELTIFTSLVSEIQVKTGGFEAEHGPRAV
jgi:hypothetical protein